MHPHSPDNILVQQTLTGNQQAFKKLVERYQNMVFTIALRITGKREDAEETAQDIFVKAYRGLGAFEGKSKFSSWLYRIAYNTALTKVRNHAPQITDLDGEKNNLANNINTAVYNHAEKNMQAADVTKAVNELNAEDATVITLFYLAEQSIDEVAEVLQIEPNAAKVRLHRARKKLKEKMETEGLV